MTHRAGARDLLWAERHISFRTFFESIFRWGQQPGRLVNARYLALRRTRESRHVAVGRINRVVFKSSS